MKWRGGSNAVAELRTHWSRWTQIVALHVHRRRARRKVDPSDYVALHSELMLTCRSLAEMLHDEERAYFLNLENIAKPWMNPHSFRQADREILENLLRLCHRVEKELGGRSWRFPDLRRYFRLPFPFVAGTALIVIFWATRRAWAPMFQHGRTWSEAFRVCLDRTTYTHSLLVPAILVVVTSSYVVSRSAHH